MGLPNRGVQLAAALGDPDVAVYRPTPMGPPEARLAIAEDLARHGAAVAPEQIVLTASSSESYALVWKLLADPGDVILVPEPSYPLFECLAALEGCKLRRYHLAFDGQWHIDWPSVEAAIADARAIVVVNPNNPTGSWLTARDWQRLGDLAARHDVAIVVDEVFLDYPAGDADVRLGSVTAHPGPALTFALGGLSKSCGLPQLKLGWMVALGPAALVNAALSRLELIADSYLSVATPVLTALPSLLRIGTAIRSDIVARLDLNRATVASCLSPGGLVEALPSQGGWSAILRLPGVMSDEAWALTLLSEDGLLVQPGYFYDLAAAGTTLVVSLLTPPAALFSGLQGIRARVEREAG